MTNWNTTWRQKSMLNILLACLLAWLINWLIARSVDRLMIDQLIYRSIDLSIDWLIDWLIDWFDLIDWLIDWLPWHRWNPRNPTNCPYWVPHRPMLPMLTYVLPWKCTIHCWLLIHATCELLQAWGFPQPFWMLWNIRLSKLPTCWLSVGARPRPIMIKVWA